MPSLSSSRHLQVALHAAFLLSGTATVLIGQILPLLARKYQLNDLEAGFYFPAQFAGSLAGTILTSIFARRDRYMDATVLGTALMGIAVLIFNIGSFPVSIAAFVLLGTGIGLTLPAINMTVLEMNTERAGSALSTLNFCWGVGAIVCKPFVDATQADGNLLLTTLALSIPILASCGYLALQPRRRPLGPTDDTHTPTDAKPIWITPMAWGIAAFNFVHVGFESSMGGWLTTYAERVPGGLGLASLLAPTVLYFVFFVFGRGIASGLFRFLDENKMLFLGLAIMLVGMLITVTANSILALGFGASVTGFGTSWIFPTNVSRFYRAFGHGASRRATPFFVCGTLGSALMTWLVGFVSNRTGDLRNGMYTLLAAVLILLALQFVLGRTSRA